jgi:murein L,D-transpeptidase YafK
MRAFLLILSLFGLFGLTSCSEFKTYDGPEVTRVLIYKESRMMYLMHHETALASYPVNLGFAPVGDKEREGDGRTPEGDYIVDRKNPESEFHLSLGISYPDIHDVAAALEAGVSPGGDIFIHGGPADPRDRNRPDWTAGCIAVTDREIEDIYAMVKVGTPITIYP